MGLDSKLFISKIFLEKDKISSFTDYPFNIDLVRTFEEVNFTAPVTFFIGENGIGKSTFIEAIATALGLNPEGGTENFHFKTNDTHSSLSDYLRVWMYHEPKMKYFLRAESFYNVASEIERISMDPDKPWPNLFKFYGGNLHHCSHGESFLKLVQNRFSDHGLYILDEPEAALSPARQMTLLCLIDDLVKQGSQFIIATHSPILISYRNGEILDLNQNFKHVNYQDTEIYQTYKLYLEDPEGMQRRLFD